MCEERTRTIEPARALAAETLNLERTLSDLADQAYALTPAEIALMWKTAPLRMPIPRPQHHLELLQIALPPIKRGALCIAGKSQIGLQKPYVKRVTVLP